MTYTRLLIVSCSILILSTCGSSNRPPSVVDILTYRSYITELRANLALADATSFEEGEQAQLTTLSGQILQTLGEANSFNELDDEQKENLIVTNEKLHAMIVGEDESRVTRRICRTDVSLGSNIRSRSCRTAGRMTENRQAARQVLLEREDALLLER